VDLGRRALARNTAYNLAGQGLPLVVALVAVPLLIRGLGMPRFGLLGLVWMFVTLFGELGFGRSATRFAAEALGAGKPQRAKRVLAVTLRAQAVLGLGVGVVTAAAVPWLVATVFSVEPALRHEAQWVFYLLAASVPAMSLAGAYRGVLEAAQRFGVLNAVRFTVSTLNYLLPLAALALGWGLVGVVAILLLLRVAQVVALAWAVRLQVPDGGGASLPDDDLDAVSTRQVVTFGAWVTVSTVVSPVLVYLDRFLLGALTGVVAVGVYTAPFELVTRLLLIPGSLAATLFPAFSALEGMGRGRESGRVMVRGTAAVLAVVAPLSVAVVWGAGPILTAWLGPDATPAGVMALRILAVGVLANAAAFVPFALLQGLGRADVTARFHLVELPIHAMVAWVLISRWGVAGAAAAWSFRAALDAGLLFGAAVVVLRRRATA
jgi:O-antigen/teichoic acid export membrane protein